MCKGGGGIAIYTKKDLVFDYRYENDISTDDIELVHITLRFEYQKDIDIWAVYRPPSGNYQNAVDHMNTCLGLYSRPNEAILIGDFNIDLLNSRCPKKKSLCKLMDSFSLYSLIATLTRVTNTSSTVIDHIYTNINQVSMHGTLNVNIADHLPIFLIKKKNRVHKDYIEVSYRSFPEESKDEFAAELLAQVELIPFGSNEPNTVWQCFFQIVVTLLDKYCPVRTVKIRMNSNSYVDSALSLLMKQRDIAFRKARRHNRPQDWIVARKLRSEVQTFPLEGPTQICVGSVNKCQWGQ